MPPSLCAVSGTLLKATGEPFVGAVVKSLRVRQGEAIISSITRTLGVADSNGGISFNLIQGSLVVIQGNFWHATYSFSAGLEIYCPRQASVDFADLLSTADALLNL